eukprot:15366664-Ditylum_brightwellii.AAC.3
MSCRNTSFTADSDARACYYWVISEITTLAQYQAGLPKHTAVFSLYALKQMKYHMVISYGIDSKSFQTTKESPIYGIGEGAMDTPPDWTIVPHIC